MSRFGNRKLCDDCNQIHRKVRAREHEKNRKRRIIAKEVRAKGIVCVNCGDLVEISSQGVIPKYCPECRKNRSKIYEAKHRVRGPSDPKQTQKHKLKYRFGISVERYEAMVKNQGGKCAGCGNPPKPNKVLYIDHDHACCSGEKSCGECIRQLLCQQCNTALGWINDDKKILESMIQYLEQGGTKGSPNSQRLASPPVDCGPDPAKTAPTPKGSLNL